MGELRKKPQEDNRFRPAGSYFAANVLLKRRSEYGLRFGQSVQLEVTMSWDDKKKGTVPTDAVLQVIQKGERTGVLAKDVVKDPEKLIQHLKSNLSGRKVSNGSVPLKPKQVDIALRILKEKYQGKRVTQKPRKKTQLERLRDL